MNHTVKTSVKLSSEAIESPAFTIFRVTTVPSGSVINTLSLPLSTTKKFSSASPENYNAAIKYLKPVLNQSFLYSLTFLPMRNKNCPATICIVSMCLQSSRNKGRSKIPNILWGENQRNKST